MGIRQAQNKINQKLLGLPTDIVNLAQGYQIPVSYSPLPAGVSLHPDGSISFKKSQGLLRNGIDDVPRLIRNILVSRAKSNKFNMFSYEDGNPDIQVVRYKENGNEEIKSPSISFRVIEGVNGAFGSGEAMGPSTKQVSPVLRDIIDHPKIEDEKVLILSHNKDYLIELRVEANRAEDVDRLRQWIERAIDANLWYFKYSGVDRFYFHRRSSDEFSSVESNSIHCRPLLYYVSIQTLTWQTVSVFKELQLNVSLR